MKILSLILLLFTSINTYGLTINKNFTVQQIFAEGSDRAGFYPKEGLSECKWNIMYIDLSKESGKSMFAIVLAAKASGAKINRIDYSVSSSGTCLASGIHSV